MIISEYTEGNRNAKVLKMNKGGFLVLLWDANREIDEHTTFYDLELAEDFAEDWVMKYVNITL